MKIHTGLLARSLSINSAPYHDGYTVAVAGKSRPDRGIGTTFGTGNCGGTSLGSTNDDSEGGSYTCFDGRSIEAGNGSGACGPDGKCLV